MKTDESFEARPPKWEALVLVCKACGKRGSGPKDKNLKPKHVAQQLRGAAKRQRMRSRVVLTTCLGLCPKRATAVVVALQGGSGQQIVAVGSQATLQGVAALLQPATEGVPLSAGPD